MASTNNASLSAEGTLTKNKPAAINDYKGLEHASGISTVQEPCDVKPVTIKVEDGPDGAVPGFLHLPQRWAEKATDNSNVATILLSGAGGGVTGPSGMYLSIADKLASIRNGMPVLRLDYRFPARNKFCVDDVRASMKSLESDYMCSRFILVGWSFGGAPVFTVGGADHRVIGCATVASQTAETEGIRSLSPRPVFLLHGTGDRTLSPACSERLYAMYGTSGDRRIALFDRDDHALTKNAAKAEELLCEFVLEVAGKEAGQDEKKVVLAKPLVEEGQRVDKMRKGGDLRGGEHLE